MENIPILEGISPDEVEQMRVCFGVREERFRADTVIYDISEGRGELGLLTAGSAVIQRIDRQGGRTILEHLPTGSVFGEMLMFENVAGDSITVVAAEPCRVWFMSAEHLTRRCEKACTHHSRLVENMFHIMTGKAAALSERVEVLSRRSIREKLLCYFGLQTGGDDSRRAAEAVIRVDDFTAEKHFVAVFAQVLDDQSGCVELAPALFRKCVNLTTDFHQLIFVLIQTTGHKKFSKQVVIPIKI